MDKISLGYVRHTCENRGFAYEVIAVAKEPDSSWRVVRRPLDIATQSGHLRCGATSVSTFKIRSQNRTAGEFL